MASQVPPVAGVWRREWEEDPLGDAEGADRDTLVIWTQPGESGLYVDIRLPLESPGRSVEAARRAGIVPRPGAIASNGLSDTAKKQLIDRTLVEVIMRQKSFAGVLEYKVGDTTKSGEALKKDTVLAKLAESSDASALALCTCFWRRDIDFQPPSGGLDIGVCASEPVNPEDGKVLLRETGDDASYAECWLRLPHTVKGPFLALELVSENDKVGCRSGYWVRAGDRFAYAVGRPRTAEAEDFLQCSKGSHQINDCVGKILSEAITSVTSDHSIILDIAGSYMCAAGKINSEHEWIILHSTNPELVGCSLVGDSSKQVRCSLVGDSSKQDRCCSRLVPIEGNCVIGCEVEQVLVGVGVSDMKRRWKVVEISGCSLPFE